VDTPQQLRDGLVGFPSSHDIFPEILDPYLFVLGKLLRAGNEVLIVTKPNIECISAICAVSQFFKDKLNSLPKCSNSQLVKIAQEGFDPLTAKCKDTRVNLDKEIDTFVAEFTGVDSIFDTEITQEDAEISDANQDIAKFAFDSLGSLTWMFWVLVASFTVVIIVTSKTLHRGLKSTGLMHVVLGATLLLMYLFVVTPTNINSNIVSEQELSESERQAMLNIVEPLTASFVGKLSSEITVISIILIASGLCLFLIGVLATRHHVEHLYLPRRKHEFKIDPDKLDKDKTGDKPKDDKPSSDSQKPEEKDVINEGQPKTPETSETKPQELSAKEDAKKEDQPKTKKIQL
jgi:hypothetical protein